MRETADQARTRRRWISLAEVVAVAGVVIAALTLWNSWTERRETRATQAAEQASAAHSASRVDLAATPRDGGRELLLKDERHGIQDVTIAFPRTLGLADQRPVADPVIAAEPLSDPLLKLADAAKADAGRVPVLVTTSYLDGDATRRATGIYDVIWRRTGKFPFGHALRLEDLRLRERSGSAARLDALWGREKPKGS